ncbi:MAG: choice-of-anchor J domain-containing protein [Bacteroidota bacterium]
MKIKFTLLVLAACCVFRMNAQVIISENFNNPNALTGWIKDNKSNPQGITTWFTGNPGVFPAFSSPDSSYIAANYNNTTGGSGTISNWLITPTVTLNNGGVLQFATRTNTAAPQSIAPDRLQVYMSTAGTGSDVGTTATSLGTFTTQLVNVNPNLATNVYPTVWTVYTATLAGITGTVTGRFGFRYFVTSAGPTGTNSSYIGIDNVHYELPCPNPTLTISSSTNAICSGNTFSAGASGANTYTWSSGQNTPSVTLSPTATTVYTVIASSTPNCNSTGTVAITVTLTPNLSVLNVTTCAGTAATLAASGASSYSWSTGSTSATIVDTPTMNTTYTVTGYNGVCSSSNVVSVALGSSLSINATTSQNTICSGKPAIIMASGASTYSYSAGTFSSNIHTSSVSVSPTVTTVYTIDGSSGSCMGTNTIVINVNASPALTVAASNNNQIVCVNTSITFTASGASTYSWVGNNSISSILTVVTPSASSIVNYVVVGTGTNGCSTSTTISRTIDLCTGIETVETDNRISVYPNPFNSEIKVAGVNGRIEIYNALGQLVSKEMINNTTTVNTTELSKGVYILKAYSEHDKPAGTAKLIKN